MEWKVICPLLPAAKMLNRDSEGWPLVKLIEPGPERFYLWDDPVFSWTQRLISVSGLTP
jgi:hypothetical protein